jgi:hypothetical protein
MEKITIEKIIEFDSLIDSIEYVNIDDKINYLIDEDDTHCQATLYLLGKVNTLLGNKEFNEKVDVDIYAPFEKKLDKENFKIEVKDYSYNIKQNKLIIYFIMCLTGIKNVEQEEYNDKIIEVNEPKEVNDTNDSSMLLEDINSVNVINEEVREEIKENNNKIVIVEDNVVEEMNKSWASDLFDLTNNYSLFMKFHVE